MADQDSVGSRFIVDLGKIKLRPILEKQVAAEIQAAVLRALAEVDFGSRHQFRRKISIWEQFPGQTLGLWIGPDDPPIFSPGDSDALTVGDHTLIVGTIMEQALQVLRSLPAKYRSKGARPSGKEVLQAALQVHQIDDSVKERIRLVLTILPKIEEAESTASKSVKKAVDDLRRQLKNKTIEEKLLVLRPADRKGSNRGDGFAEGMEFAARMLEDGQNSIYSPDFSFNKLLRDGHEAAQGSTGGTVAIADPASHIADADTIGATAGGAIGFFVGGIGAGPGAVAGGAGASVGAAIGDFINWLRG